MKTKNGKKDTNTNSSARCVLTTQESQELEEGAKAALLFGVARKRRPLQS